MKKTFFAGILALSVCMMLEAGQDLPQIPEVEAWRKNAANGRECTFKPVLSDTSIQYGNKTLQLFPNGDIKCVTKEHGDLFLIDMKFYADMKGKNIYRWRQQNFDAKSSRFTRKGNRYTWNLYYRMPDGKSLSLIQQILDVLPDGRLHFTGKYTFPKPTKELTFRSEAYRLQCCLYDSKWMQENVIVNNSKKIVMTRALSPFDARGKNPMITFAADNPSKKFTVQLDTTEAAFIRGMYYAPEKHFVIKLYSKDAVPNTYTAYFDLRKGVDPKSLGESRGGVIFQKQENMALTDIHEKNMVVNPSLECGFEGWIDLFTNCNFQWGLVPFKIDSTTAYDGKNSLLFNGRPGYPWHSPNIGPFQFVLNPGTYTFSFYAKGESGKKVSLHVWEVSFARTAKPVYKVFRMTPEWKRYSVTFNVPSENPVIPMQFCAIAEKETTAKVWVDAVQLERGTKATIFQPHAVEGCLLTSKTDNFFPVDGKIDGKLKIITAKPNAAGKVHITVKNFFGEILLDQTQKFKTDTSRTALLKLPLDSLPGLGVFVVKCEYKLESGENYCDFHRYAKIQYQDMPRPHKQMFSADYGYAARSYNYGEKMDRWRVLGCGSLFHHPLTIDKKLWNYEIAHGMTPYFGSMLTYIRDAGNKITHFCILNGFARRDGVKADDPDILVRDYHLDSNGTITPEYLAKIKEAVKKRVQNAPHIKIWNFGGELTCKFPKEWWGKGFTDRDVSRIHAQLLKQFVEGVKEANPKALVFQDCPANMDPSSGIAETDLLLEECNKLGVKFDVICIHPYRFTPENPDLDSDAKTFFEMLKRRGYDKAVVIWPEGMHWGPFEIPQWGTVPSGVELPPRRWFGSISYDMGWTEKKTAAWYARSWLVSLKYGDRVLGFTAGNCSNNSYIDSRLIPYAAQLIPNTMSCILGDAKFKKDIRVVPFLRTYIFEDAQKRPVAVIWNHHEDVDNAVAAAPWIIADFGDHLESVLDLMNSPRKVTHGKMRFQVSTFPLFFRGKPGTLKQMIEAFEKIDLESTVNFKPVAVNVIPVSGTQMNLTVKNIISKEFKGTLNGKPVTVPSSGSTVVTVPLPVKLQDYGIHAEKMEVTLKSEDKKTYLFDFSFNAFKVKRIPDMLELDAVAWDKLPAVRFPKYQDDKTSGEFRIGWNTLGLYLEAKIKDPKFVHVEYQQPFTRWNNDCLQIFIDTRANARERTAKGFDEDDYSYAIFPNSKGDAARLFRFRTVESQLGLATQAPRDYTFADDVPCRFSNQNGVLTYRTFIPAKYLLPIKLQKGYAFGFALFVPNSDQPGKLNGKSLTLASDGGGCHNRPHVWPVAILSE